MRRHNRDMSMSSELHLAIGLVWGHLNASQYEEGDQLARGCLRVWPECIPLKIMAAFTAVELNQGLDQPTRQLLQNTTCKEWAKVVLRRAQRNIPDLEATDV